MFADLFATYGNFFYDIWTKNRIFDFRGPHLVDRVTPPRGGGHEDRLTVTNLTCSDHVLDVGDV